MNTDETISFVLAWGAIPFYFQTPFLVQCMDADDRETKILLFQKQFPMRLIARCIDSDSFIILMDK